MNARALRGIAVVATAALLLTACAAPEEPPARVSTTTAPPGSPQPTAAVSVVAAGLDVPWSVVFHDGIPLVSERDSARILELDESGEPREVAVIDGVQPSGEGGLLGIAVHDDHLYVYFTAANDNRIERFPLSGDAGNLALGDPQTVLDGIPKSGNHNGGRIVFGPDGMLYATAGDAGDGSAAQDLDSLAGKILRLTPEGDIPDDNPFRDSPVYSYGHRNPQGIAWDGADTMYASEFGQNTWDELNVIEAGGDYGWPEVEGIAEDDRYIDPVQQWNPADASPSGIAVSDGTIFIANLRGERLREVPLDDLGAATEHWVGEYGRLRDVVVAPDGALWVLTNNTDGRGSPRDGDDRILRLGAP